MSAETNPRLVCMTGPRKGAIFPLTAEEFAIGRVATNQFSVADLKVSRRHCLIQPDAEGKFHIHDLESRNGTFVNATPVKERALEHGDQIQVGSSTLLFLLGEDEPHGSASSVELNNTGWVTASSILVQDSYSSSGVGRRAAAELAALVRISTVLGSVRGLEPLQQKLMESLAEITPADRGAVILVGKTPGEFTSIFGWDRLPGKERPVQVSRPAIDRALQERTAFIGNDLEPVPGGAKSQGRDPANDTSAGGQIASLLVVPLIVFGKTVGAIYLDASKPGVRFDEKHLQLLTAVGPIAAVALENARRLEWLESENERLQIEIGTGRDLIGESMAMKDVNKFIAKVAPSDSTVLIGGESGTGKELVARAIHRNSKRADRPFVAINCAALTESLLESEMFGHEKGAFTGAIALKKGKLEAAEGGTFFLDEVGELSPVLQAKLLRVLQEREFERVGGTRPIKVDIRLIAATNRILKEAVKEKTFRQDLYYRLNVVSVTLPPLRERREDISLLATYFIARHGEKTKHPLLGIAPEARSCLQSYDWPGNVRELENAMERAVVLGSGDVIQLEDLPDSVLEAQTQSAGGVEIPRYHEAVLETKKQLILKALESTGGSYAEAAKALGVHVNYLHRLIRNMNLKGLWKPQMNTDEHR